MRKKSIRLPLLGGFQLNNNIHIKLDNFAKAREIITEALKIELKKESLLRNVGFAYFHVEEYEETIRIFKEFHELIIAPFN